MPSLEFKLHERKGGVSYNSNERIRYLFKLKAVDGFFRQRDISEKNIERGRKTTETCDFGIKAKNRKWQQWGQISSGVVGSRLRV